MGDKAQSELIQIGWQVWDWDEKPKALRELKRIVSSLFCVYGLTVRPNRIVLRVPTDVWDNLCDCEAVEEMLRIHPELHTIEHDMCLGVGNIVMDIDDA